MATFDTTRSALNASRRQRLEVEAALARAKQVTAGLESERSSAERAHAKGDRLRKIEAQLREARANEASQREILAGLNAEVRDRASAFAPFADPRETITNWSEETPILLLPVRVETRFKTTSGPGGQEELWVRVYPDECAVDSFEPVLSKTEIESGRRFWIETWAAGGVDGQRRAAWRNLVASHGAGRAAWIVHEFAPAGAEPVKAPEDILLIIAADALPTVQQQGYLAKYWEAVWKAQGAKAPIQAALQVLEGKVGAARAAELIAQFVPANLTVAPPRSVARADVLVRVGWLLFPAPGALKTRSWTAPPRVHILPDCFVVLGYQANHLVFEAQGGVIPASLVAGPDPSAAPEEQLKHGPTGELSVPDEMSWMVDFEAAVAVGMGLKIPLDPVRVDLSRPLDRVLVVGLRLADDIEGSQLLLEELLTHHRYGRSGFAFLPQGTPTNNTEAAGAGYSRVDDANAAYDALFSAAAQLPLTIDWWQRRDGQCLADALGVDPLVFDRVPHASGRDGAEARAMNRALWPATLGYAMETMMQPVLGPEQVASTRWFYTHFVSGRGMLPAIRIGDQPYGVLPVSALSRWQWLSDDRITSIGGLASPAGFFGYRQGLASLLMKIRADWTGLANAVRAVGQRGDPHQMLLDVVGLHPSSVEFHQRYAESLDHLFNRAKLQEQAAEIHEQYRVQKLQERAMELLRRLGYDGPNEPDALSKFFFKRANRLNGPIVDDRPLSEQSPIRAYTDDNRNYIEWLADAARGSFEDLRQERGFTGDTAPDALLYLMLRHALLLGYWDSSLRLHLAADVMTEDAVTEARREPAFLHVSPDGGPSESRFAPLYSKDVRITGDATRTVADTILSGIGEAGTEGFADQLAALDQLRSVPTARLERCLSEHVDTASTRLDAWLLGLVHYQLAALRYRPAGIAGEVKARNGIHLGAYGWIENLQRKSAPLQPVSLRGDLATSFDDEALPPLVRDPTNGGYVFAPSINQATTAAVLRAGALANATPQNGDALSVNLSSARVRIALALIEGMRNGQPLGALLGYRFQRGLHEGHAPLELDRFINPLRQKFPLVAEQLASTKAPADTPIESLEANHVLDGLKLVEQTRVTGNRSYPFGLRSLPSASAAERDAINAEVEALLDAHDALADLALAEGVHQAVQGNYDRVAATLDAYAKGTFPPEPEVVRTPRSGLGLTHRVGLHFEAGLDPDVSPFGGIPVSPRARMQAMVNQWLSQVLPDPDEVACLVQWVDPVGGTLREETVTQRELKLQPIDMLYLVSLDGGAAVSELDDRILRFVIDKHDPRADAAMSIRHTVRLPAPLKTFFEVAPLIRHLRSLLLGSRPLVPSDIALPGEAERKQNSTQIIERNRVQKVRQSLIDLQQDLGNATIAAPIDKAMDDTIALFERAADFGIQQVGWGFMFEWRRRAFSDLLGRVATTVELWEKRVLQYSAALADYDAIPVATSDAVRYAALGRMDLLIASTPIRPRPSDPATYRNALNGRRQAFGVKLGQLKALLATTDPRVSRLITSIQAVFPLDSFDSAPFAIDDVLRDVDVFIKDLGSRIGALKSEVARRLASADRQLQAHGATVDPGARVRALQEAGSALLGEDMKPIPEFSFDAGQSAELANAMAASANGTLTQYLETTAAHEFPVDDWLLGIARVREKLHAWEQASELAAAFGRPELGLLPIQLPYKAGEGWLAMEFDQTTVGEGERLLYTAHHAVPPDAANPTCGVLIDEWTEVVPAANETAGLTFHYDRPGSEPPQTWLLVTPARMQGTWQWDDVIGALHETLDLARLRAIEPAQVDRLEYARFLPATSSAVSQYDISITANLSRVNQLIKYLPESNDG